MTLTGIYKKSGKVTEAQHRSPIFEGIIKKIFNAAHKIAHSSLNKVKVLSDYRPVGLQ